MSIFRRIKADTGLREPSGLTAVPGASIAIHAMMSSFYSAGAKVYDSNQNIIGSGIYGVADISSITAKAYNEARIEDLNVKASGNIGNITLHAAASGEISAYISSGQGGAKSGDIGDVTIQSIGQESSAHVELKASGGDIGRIKIIGANPNGKVQVSAWAYAGDIAGVDLIIRGGKGSGSAAVSAFGGDIGYINIVALAGRGSGRISGYAKAVVGSDGKAMGGDIGDISLLSRSMRGKGDLYVAAHGAVDDGTYLGGGNIGNISIQNLQTQGGSGELEGRFQAYNGGSIGNINVRQIFTDSYSSSANVSAFASGFSGGPVVSIGDVYHETFSRRGSDNSAYVNVKAGQRGGGGNIGKISIIFNELGGGSSELDFSASAFASPNGAGGNIGDIRLINTGYRGNSSVNLRADTSIGNIYAAMGPGSSDANIRIRGAGDVGDITFALHPLNSRATSRLTLGMDKSESVIGIVRVVGGSELSNFEFERYGHDKNWNWVPTRANAVAGVDLSQYAGSGKIYLGGENGDGGIAQGTTIHAPRGDSYIEGTAATDNVHLGAGEDRVYIHSSASNFGHDFIYDLEVLSEFSDRLSFDFSVSRHHAATSSGPATANPGASSVMAGDLLRLVDIAGGSDILTASGLLAALNGGEYANFDAGTGSGPGDALAVVASTDSTTDWRVFKLSFDGTSADFSSVRLLAIVDSNAALANISPIFGL